MSTAYHPKTDGASECTNKTIIQALRFHVAQNQKGWVHALPQVRFDLMNMINCSTGFTPFQLHMGQSLRLLHPLIPSTPNTEEERLAEELILQVHEDVCEAQDNLILARVSQAAQANKTRSEEPKFKVGDFVLLNTCNRRREYQQKRDGRTAKFMPRFDGKYKVVVLQLAIED